MASLSETAVRDVSVERVIKAPAGDIFAIVADASRHPEIDGSGSLKQLKAGAPEQLHDVLTENNVPDDEINKMTHENAMRWYSFDPFTHISREQATVGALRKAAEGHDVSIRALSHHKDRAGSSFAEFAANAKTLTGNTD